MKNAHPRVYLAYSARDRDFARILSNAIEENGGEAPLAEDFLTPGSDVQDAITQQIKDSNILVFVVPQHEGEGQWALFEIGAAKAMRKRIMAIVPDRMRSANTDVAVRLADYMIMDAVEKSTKELARSVVEAAAA